MDSQMSLLHHKEQFENLYDAVSEGDNKKYIKTIINDINHQLTNKNLFEGYLKLYFDFYDRLLVTIEKNAN